MMKKLLEHTKQGVEMELQEARKNCGVYFHSRHEGFGVITEECLEAGLEIKLVGDLLGQLLTYIHLEDGDSLRDTLDALEEHATLAACEYQQVAAMARKMQESLEVGKY